MVSVGLGIPNHDVLPGVSAGDHHAEVAASDFNFADLADVTAAGDATAAELETLTDTSDADALHTHPVHPLAGTQAQIEAQAAGVLFATLALLRHHPGMVKAFCSITATGILEADSANIASVTDVGTGSRIIVFGDDFTSTTFTCINGMFNQDHTVGCYYESRANGTVVHKVFQTATLADFGTMSAFLGAQ